MKKIMCLCCLLCFSSVWGAKVVPFNKIVAYVNQSVISQQQMDKQIEMIKQQAQAAKQVAPSGKALKKLALDSLIDRELERMMVKKLGITITSKQVNQAIAQVAKQHQLSLSGLYQQLSEEGTSKADFSQQIKEQLALHDLIAQVVVPTIKISSQDIKAYQSEKAPLSYHLVDYLVVEQKDGASVQKSAQQLAHQLKQGPWTKKGAKQTDLGWRQKSKLPEVFAEAVAGKSAGAVMGPFDMPNGYHVIQLVALRHKGDAVSDEQARQALLNKKIPLAAQDWLKTLRGQAYIKIND
jgi:peptidyl-prolyl cis-trans isomerase SurA